MTSIPIYRGAAISFCYDPRRINFCACKKVGDGIVEKDLDLSWNEIVDETSIERLVNDSIELAHLQGVEFYSDETPSSYYVPIAIGWNDPYENPNMDFLKDIELPGSIPESRIESDIRFQNLFRLVYSYHQQNNHIPLSALAVGRGTYLPSLKNRIIDRVYEEQIGSLEALHNRAKSGDVDAMESLITIAKMVIMDRTMSLRDEFPLDYKRARFLDLNKPYHQFLKLPEIILIMKEEVGKILEVDSRFVRIKFPDDDKHDHFFDVVAAEMEDTIASRVA